MNIIPDPLMEVENYNNTVAIIDNPEAKNSTDHDSWRMGNLYKNSNMDNSDIYLFNPNKSNMKTRSDTICFFLNG
jgi:type V secretory pathway adhesin AidA